jgi:hypothetical protein
LLSAISSKLCLKSSVPIKAVLHDTRLDGGCIVESLEDRKASVGYAQVTDLVGDIGFKSLPCSDGFVYGLKRAV